MLRKQSFNLTLGLLLLFAPVFLFGQNYEQTVKGVALDQGIKTPLIGATVAITDLDPVIGAITDENGRFRLEHVPVGTHQLRITYMGYKPAILSNLIVNSGKEVDLVVELEEEVLMGNEVVIRAQLDKEKPLNELSTVSARTFSVEETQRFAAAVNDPARMASAYAGVVVADDGNNTIIIRGNAPNGLLWRMEGVDIPNPNHFSDVNTSGGGISILSAQLLSNSDFVTGAFAAEYGNALSGVFDLKLRKGNADKYEYTFKAGFLGMDAAAEGPIRMGNQQTGSFLVNYRYSTLSLLDRMGVNIGYGTTDFQDLSFNIWMPAGKAGSFTAFGLGGLSSQTAQGVADSLIWKDEPYKKYTSDFRANTGVAGITHSKAWDKTYLKTVFAASSTENGYSEDQFLNDYESQHNATEQHVQRTYTLSSVLSHKFNPSHYLRVGAYAKYIDFDFNQAYWDETNEYLKEEINVQGQTQTVQAFAQWQFRPSKQWTLNAGLHSFALLLNKQFSVEPRAALKYQMNPKQSLSFGYGLHSQMQPLGVYFVKQPNQSSYINRDLEMTKAHHYVLAFDQMLPHQLHAKVEAYYQDLFNVPVLAGAPSHFSMLNEEYGFVDMPLENSGKGRNYGVELTFEKFLTNGLYFLLSSSVYQSKYRGSDMQWRDTRFNGNYANSLVAGKEWKLKRKNRSLGVNLKLTQMGGLRESPVDLEASILAGQTVRDHSRAFEDQAPQYLRMDTGFQLTRNFENVTTTLALNIQNTTNHNNVYGQYFNKETQQLENAYMAGLIPILSYKVQF
ncbi:MAG: TonB-dependent receptor [Saprospiraceae bacterium]